VNLQLEVGSGTRRTQLTGACEILNNKKERGINVNPAKKIVAVFVTFSFDIVLP
jgi:hypothetical protein